jgi:PKD repeat protein
VDVVTGTDGRATFIVTAPALSTPAEKITVYASPFGSNAEEALTRNLTIALTGTQNTTAPTPEFTFTPEAPVAGGQIVFDASATMDEGQVCGGACSYSWNFGGLGAGTTVGMVVMRNAIDEGTWGVTLTVTDSTGTVASITHAVTVEPPAP